MKTILEFDLNGEDVYEEELSLKRCLNSTNAYIALSEIVNTTIRNYHKYGKLGDKNVENLKTREELLGALEDAFAEINDTVHTHVDLNDLY